MKNQYKYFVFLLIYVFGINATFSQTTKPTLWGLSYAGGVSGVGNVYSYDIGTSGVNSVINKVNFSSNERPTGSLILSADKTIMYGMTMAGGTLDSGRIFSYNLLNKTTTTLHNFAGNVKGDGASPYGSLLLASDGNLYGMTNKGGKYGYGVIFGLNGKTYKVLHEFESMGDGANPYGSLVEIDKVLYGMTYSGGDATGKTQGLGTIFGITLDGSSYKNYVFPADSSKGARPYGSLVLGADKATLYGMTRLGSAKIGPAGVVFAFDVTKLVISKVLKGFFGVNNRNVTDGAYPYGDLTYVAANNTMYGLTYQGMEVSATNNIGTPRYGALFSIALSDFKYYVIKLFNNDNTGMYPLGTLTLSQANPSTLYGTTVFGPTTAANNGVLFSYEISKGTFTKICDFGGVNAKYSYFSKLLEYNAPVCKTVEQPKVDQKQTVCYGTSKALTAGITLSGASLLWYGQDTTSNPSLIPTILPATLKENGSYVFYVSQVLNGCESVKVPINVTVNSLPATPTFKSRLIYYCKGAITGSLSSYVASQTNNTLNWYGNLSSGGTATSTAPVPLSDTEGMKYYYVSQVSTSTGCESPRDSIGVGIYPLPLAPAGRDTAYCLNQVVDTLKVPQLYYVLPIATAFITRPYIVKWYDINGKQLISSPKPSTAKDGIQKFLVSQTHPTTGCESPKDTIVVDVHPKPSKPTVVSPLAACSSGVAPTITAIANAGNTLIWYLNSMGNQLKGSPVLSTSNVGTSFYYVRQMEYVGSVGCIGDTATIKYTVNSLPTTPVYSLISDTAISVCQFSNTKNIFSKIISLNSKSTLYWYSPSSTKPQTTPPVVDSSVVGKAYYYVSSVQNGCESFKLKVSVTVNPSPAAPVAPVIASVCAGQKFILSVSDKPVGSFFWYTTPTGGVPNSNPFSTSINSATTFYLIDSVASSGCKSARVAVKVPVTTPVLPTVSLSSASDTVCLGSSLILTANYTNGGTTPQFTWTVGTLNPITTSTNTYTITPTGTTTVNVTLKSSLTCLSANNVTVSKTIFVASSILPGIKIGTSSTTVCKGVAVSISSSIANGGVAPTYQWFKNKVAISGATSGIYTDASLANGDSLYATITSNSTCVATANKTQKSNVLKFTVLNSSIPTLSLTKPSVVCSGSVASFKAVPASADKFAKYQWYLNNNLVQDWDTTTVYSTNAISSLKRDTIKVVLATNLACPTVATIEKSDTIKALPVLTPTVLISSTPTSTTYICPNTAVSFNSTITNGGLTPGYQWFLNGLAVTGQTTASFTKSTWNSNDEVSLRMASSYACVNSKLVESNKLVFFVDSLKTPKVMITTSSNNICNGTAVKFKAISINGGVKPVYKWFVNNVVQSAFVGDSLVITTLANKDSVYVVMTSNANCIKTSTATSSKIKMVVNTKVVPAVSISASKTNVCKNDTVVFTATAVNGGTNPTYNWKLNGVNQATVFSNNNVFTNIPNSNIVVSVSMKTSLACVTADTVVSVSNSSINVTTKTFPTLTITANKDSACTGSAVVFKAKSQSTSDKYLWKINGLPQGSETTLDSVVFSNLKSTDLVSVRLRSALQCRTVDTLVSPSRGIKILAVPAITLQPASKTVCDGSNSSLTVRASGSGISYKWFENGFEMPSTNSSTLLFPKINTTKNNNQYSVQISGNCLPSLMSNTATLKVLQLPTIVAEPVSTQACPSDNAQFALKASGDSLSYKWFLGATQVLNVNNSIEGASNDTLLIKKASNRFTNLRSIVSNVCGADTSQLVSLDLINTATVTPVLSILASDSVICNGTTVTFKALSNNAGVLPSLVWYVNKRRIIGNTSNTLVLSNLSDKDSVYCKMYPALSCYKGDTLVSSKIVRVNSLIPQVVTVKNASICDSASISLIAKGNNNTTVIRWFSVASGGSQVFSGDTLKLTNAKNSVTYFVEAFDRGCVSSRKPVSVTVNKQAFVSVGVDRTVCESVDSLVLVAQSNTNSVTWTKLGAVSVVLPSKDSLTSVYKISNADVTSGFALFEASTTQNGTCKLAKDTVRFIVVAAQNGGHLVPNDSIVIANLIKNNMPATSTYKANNISTWAGIGSACGYVTSIRLVNKGIDGTVKGLEALSKLEVLDLSNNSIDSLGFVLAALDTNMRVIKLANNNISYARIINFINYPYLDTLDLSSNKFTSIVNFNSLSSPNVVNLSRNVIAKVVFGPSSTRNFRTLKLDVSRNQMSKNQIQGLDNLKDLTHFDISYNLFVDTIPPIGLEFANLEYFNASHNLFSGGIANLSSLFNIKTIDLGNNRFVGNQFGDLKGLKKLEYFAVDSNALARTENNSGITGLPQLPLNTGLKLQVQNNHLDFEDLEPYSFAFNKISASYVPQFDSVDQSYSVRPSEGSFFAMRTTLGGNNNVYQWQKLNKKSNVFEVISGATLQAYKKQLQSSDTGVYNVKITNTSFPGLVFIRRTINVESCLTQYFISLKVKKATQDNCLFNDTLSLTFKDLAKKKVESFNNSWYFNGLEVVGESDTLLPMYVAGKYSVLAYDYLTGCSVFSKDTSITTFGITPKLKYSVKDETIYCDSNFKAYQWVVNGLPIAGANDSKLKVYLNGEYSLIVTDTTLGCTNSSIIVKINDFQRIFNREDYLLNSQGQVVLTQNESSMSLFPNPSTEGFYVYGADAGTMVVLYNAFGMKQYEGNMNNGDFVDTYNLASGIYMLKAQVGGVEKTIKVMVAH